MSGQTVLPIFNGKTFGRSLGSFSVSFRLDVYGCILNEFDSCLSVGGSLTRTEILMIKKVNSSRKAKVAKTLLRTVL